MASAVLTFLASLLICPLSYLDGGRSPRPSPVLNVYLLGSSLFDAVQVRTLWSAGLQNLAIVSSVGLGFKVLLLVLEALPKRTLKAEAEIIISREEKCGVYSLRTFWWLNELLWLGRRQSLKLSNLYSIDPDLKTARYSSQLADHWHTVDHDKKYSLLLAVFSTLKWPLLAPALPRLILIGSVRPRLFYGHGNMLTLHPELASISRNHCLSNGHYFLLIKAMTSQMTILAMALLEPRCWSMVGLLCVTPCAQETLLEHTTRC